MKRHNKQYANDVTKSLQSFSGAEAIIALRATRNQREYRALRTAGWEFEGYDGDFVAFYRHSSVDRVVPKREALGMLEVEQ